MAIQFLNQYQAGNICIIRCVYIIIFDLLNTSTMASSLSPFAIVASVHTIRVAFIELNATNDSSVIIELPLSATVDILYVESVYDGLLLLINCRNPRDGMLQS